MSKVKSELKDLGIGELQKKIEELRAELFSMTLNASTNPIKDYSRFKKLRRTIARALTYLRQKSHELM